MHGLIFAVARSDWTYGASILTFAFPMILFIAVGAALWVLYTKPHLVPGHRYRMDGRASLTTPGVNVPGAQASQAGTAGAGEGGVGTGEGSAATSEAGTGIGEGGTGTGEGSTGAGKGSTPQGGAVAGGPAAGQAE